MNRQLVKAAFGAFVLTLALAGKAIAAPITGAIDFSGSATLDSINLLDATKVVTWENVVVGDLAAGTALDTTIDVGDAVTMANDWTFGWGKDNLWTVGGFTFDLTSSEISVSEAVGLPGGGNVFILAVSGMGWLSGNGYDVTEGTWVFTSQATNAHVNSKFTFSASTGAVPDGGTTALLLGSALTALALFSRRRFV